MGELKNKLKKLEETRRISCVFRLHVSEYKGYERVMCLEYRTENSYTLHIYPINKWLDSEPVLIENLCKQELEEVVAGWRRGFQNDVNRLIEEKEDREKEAEKRLFEGKRLNKAFDEVSNRCFNLEI